MYEESLQRQKAEVTLLEKGGDLRSREEVEVIFKRTRQHEADIEASIPELRSKSLRVAFYVSIHSYFNNYRKYKIFIHRNIQFTYI